MHEREPELTIYRQYRDEAMDAIERDNPSLKDVLPTNYARQALDKRRVGQVIDLISNVKVGDEGARSKDVLGRVYEYFLSQFVIDEVRGGGAVTCDGYVTNLAPGEDF